MSLILSVLFGQHGLLSTETKEKAAAKLIKAGIGIGIIPAGNGTNHTGGREELDIHFPAHDARRRFIGDPSLRVTDFEDFGEPEEDEETNKPSREDEAKIHNILTELVVVRSNIVRNICKSIDRIPAASSK